MTPEEQQAIMDAWVADLKTNDDPKKTKRAGNRLYWYYHLTDFIFWLAVIFATGAVLYALPIIFSTTL